MAKILIAFLLILFFALVSYTLRERLGSKALPFFVILCIVGFGAGDISVKLRGER